MSELLLFAFPITASPSFCHTLFHCVVLSHFFVAVVVSGQLESYLCLSFLSTEGFRQDPAK